MSSIFWHDYETFGSDPRRDRPCQFAGIRTDLDLNPIDAPVELFCRPAPDFLPDPGAVAVTGITPGEALRKGLPEAEFCSRIAGEFLEPGTCVAGYNSLRFDDEVTRHLFYRCLRDPYEREWKHGNSRWDLIDLLRMTQALRPQGIVWPEREPGVPSFRLEALTEANDIAHVGAHDALVDVRATIAMARLVKQQQPKLYDWYFGLRSKQRVLPLLDLKKQEPVVHVSRRYPAARGCMAIVLPLCRHPQNANGIVVVDLLADPAAWLHCDADTLRQRLYTTSADLPQGEARIPLKTVHINRCPALAPLNVLTAAVQERYALDLTLVQRHREAVLGSRDLVARLQQVFATSEWPQVNDPDQQLYSGAFFDDHDKRQMESLHRLPPAQLGALHCDFHDARLPELLFRFRARNYPETLSVGEQARWLQYCRQRLLGKLPGAGLALAAFDTALREAEAAGLGATLAAELRAYAQTLAAQCQLEQA